MDKIGGRTLKNGDNTPVDRGNIARNKYLDRGGKYGNNAGAREQAFNIGCIALEKGNNKLVFSGDITCEK